MQQHPPRSSGHYRGDEPAGEIDGGRRAGRALHREALGAADVSPTAALGRMSVPGTIALDSSGDATVLALAPTGIGPGMTARHGIERLALHGGTPRRAPRA
jgi:hypothetical protein